MQPDVRIVLRFWKKPKRRNKNNTYKSPEDFSGRRSDYLPGIFVLYRYGYSGYKLVIVRYCHLVMGMVFDLIPIVIAWGTIALVIATYTPVFNWISYPMGLYMKLFLIFMERTLIAIPLIMEVDFCPVLCITEVPVLQAFRGISHFVWYCKAVSDLS